MDRLGVRAILIFAFLLAVVGFYTFATAPAMPQLSTTLLLMATGCGVIGGQVGITTLASMIYPVAIRSTGLGWALGIGRVGSIVGPSVGGYLIATGLAREARVSRVRRSGADRRSVHRAATIAAERATRARTRRVTRSASRARIRDESTMEHVL